MSKTKTTREEHHHGVTHKQSVAEKLAFAHHSSGQEGFLRERHGAPAVEHAHHSTGHEGFMEHGPDDEEDDDGDE